jgi:hypothetical protein
VGAIVDWLRHNRGHKDRKVHLEIDGDVIDLTGADDETEKRLVDAFIQRHSAPPSTG